MRDDSPAPGLDALMAQAQWLRRLARVLAVDGADADDLVQETWIQAITYPPDSQRPARPWLAEVMRNVRRMSARGATRRRQREQRSLHAGSTEVPGTDALLESLELQRRIATLVRELDEPYRTTVLLRFYEGHSSSTIAAAQKVPAGTVRWRLAEGLRRLRQKLDDAHGGHRAAWALVAAPLAERTAGPLRSATRPGPALALGLGGLVVTLAGVLVWVNLRDPRPPGPEQPPAMTAAVAPSADPPPSRPIAPTTTTQGDENMRQARKAAALFGVVLPALIAGADDANRPLTRTQAINACVAFKERSLSCADLLADHFVRDVPPEQRAKLRQKALKELKEEGSGPIEPRRRKCAEDVDQKEKGRPPFGLFTAGHLTALEACDKEPDCPARVACWFQVAARAGSEAR